MIDKLVESFQNLFDSGVEAAPKVLTIVVLLILALVVAKIVQKILRAALVRVKFDTLLGKAGVDTALKRIGIGRQMSEFVPRLVYYLLLFLVAKAVADAYGLVAVSEALNSFFAYLPSLVSALVLVLVGSTVGPFVGQMVARAATGSGIEFGPTLGRLVSALILFVTGLMALAQLKIDTEIVRLVTAFVLAGFAVAFGLSFGLGTREITRNIAAGFYARRILRVGDPLEISGQRGVLKGITATHTMIESEQRTISISNATILDEVCKQ